jgi:phosphoserine phosphatase
VNKNSRQIDDLIRVLEISRHLVLIQDLQTLIRQIEQAAVTVLNCERATVFVFDSYANELYSLLIDRPEKIHISSDCGIAGNCFQNAIAINVPAAQKDPRFNNATDLRTGFTTRNILAAPLFGDRQNILGVLEVLNKKKGIFGKWDEFLLEVLSAQCGIAIQRQALIEEFAERKRLQQELAIAREIQKSLLPAFAPVIAGFDIAGWSQSAEETGGDFFDFHTNSAGDLLMILADVSGHGVDPALLAAECSALQRAVFTLTKDYRLSLTQLNTMLCQNIPGDRFITAFTGYLNVQNNTLSFLSAGHGPVYILRTLDGCIDTLPVTGLPLGIKPDARYDSWQTVTLNPGDMLVAFTDGFFEWEDSSGICFGTERICQSVMRYAELPAARIIDCVHQDLLSFVKGTKQQDDLTAVIVKKLI